MEKISLPVRIFAVVIVLVGLGGMLAMRSMSPSVDESAPIPQPAQKAAPAKAAKPTKAGPPKPAAAKAAKPTPKPPVNPVVPPSGFPVVVDRALQQHRVVVVSLVVPGARVDEIAAAEAEAGVTSSAAPASSRSTSSTRGRPRAARQARLRPGSERARDQAIR